MDKYSIKIIMVTSWGDGFDRIANKLCAEAAEQGYRFHSASPLNTTQKSEGRTLFSQTFILEKGANHEHDA